MDMKFLILSIFWVPFIRTTAGIPIPPRYDGFIFSDTSSSSSPVLLEAFIDPLCSDSADAWPTVKRIAQHFQDDLMLIVHPFPLPYHHNAFFACRAMHIINKLNSTLTYPLLELFFENQDSFSTSGTIEETPSSVIERIVELATNSFSNLVSSGFESDFKAGFSDPGMDMMTRISFKFGCSRVVVGTPYFFVNGIPVYDADSSWNFIQWAELIEPLIGNNKGAHSIA
ncbi:hypothetical protein KP509_19G031900 [Ceratopteris richardii]|uniref:Thioredoxin-like fold domain-containing protein n=1 Tax=Ceratopteris richardii TaxID=49495 RepID=A0A8T2SKX8_CERRI|nr:hypothetical protein KP509_19G031900 [Ceratopteris richardii]